MATILQALAADWLLSLSQLEQEVVLAALIDTIHGFDDASIDQHVARAEEMLDSLDLVMNGAKPEGFAAGVPSEARPVLWACLWGTIRNVHAPLDNLTEHQWKLAELYLKTLNR